MLIVVKCFMGYFVLAWTKNQFWNIFKGIVPKETDKTNLSYGFNYTKDCRIVKLRKKPVCYCTVFNGSCSMKKIEGSY
jgi:hypothetical protein